MAVFGEHAEEFLKFCDAGEKDGVLTCEEFCAGIIEDTKEMSDDEFKANWLDRMSKCIEDAKPAAPEKPDMKLAMEKGIAVGLEPQADRHRHLRRQHHSPALRRKDSSVRIPAKSAGQARS